MSVFSEVHLVLGASAAFILDSGIMLSCRIDVLMTENVRNEVDIAGFLIKRRAVCASKLMGRNPL